MAAMLCRHNASEILGVTLDRGNDEAPVILVTVQGDGVTAYDLEQRRVGNFPLASRSSAQFQTTSIQHTADAGPDQPRRTLVASVVRDQAGSSQALCAFNAASAARPVADAESRVALPSPAHSCHFLHSSSFLAPRIAVVFSDGRVGITDGTGEAGLGPLSLLQSPPAPARIVLSASNQDTLIVATQPAPGSPASLRVLRLAASSSGTTTLHQAKTASLPCPGPTTTAGSATPIGLTLTPAFALVQWSNGHATAVHGISAAAAGPLRPCTFPLADALSSNGASSSAPSAAAPTDPAASGRKRKNAPGGTPGGAAAGAKARPRVLCAAVDERQFVVLDLESGAAQSQVCYSLHDAQFGCPLSSGTVDVDAPLLSLDASACAVVGTAPGGSIVVRLGGGVHVLRVPTEPVSLLSLVARLAVSAAEQPPRPAAGGAAVAAALTALPAPMTIDSALLAGAGAAGEDPAASLQPVPPAAVNRLDDICNSLIQQLSAAAAAAAAGAAAPPPTTLLESSVSYIAGCRQHSMPVPPQLLSLTARMLAAAKQWPQLGALLSYVPPEGLPACSEVLTAAAAAQQYDLLPRLATCLDEVAPTALVSALQSLLEPTTSSNLASRQQHYATLRRTAEALVAGAEAAVAGGAPMPPPLMAAVRQHGRRGSMQQGGGGEGGLAAAVALAQCGAAAVDGFSYREATLHPLLAMGVDAPAVQVALRRLPAAAADALLACLAKWAAKYAGGALGEAAAVAVLPQELLFPTYHQVLEWVRMLLDAHLTRLLMARPPHPALLSLEASLGGALEGGRRLAALRGALEHVAAAAPLPAAALAAAAQYTAEVLDLRVR